MKSLNDVERACKRMFAQKKIEERQAKEKAKAKVKEKVTNERGREMNEREKARDEKMKAKEKEREKFLDEKMAKWYNERKDFVNIPKPSPTKDGQYQYDKWRRWNETIWTCYAGGRYDVEKAKEAWEASEYAGGDDDDAGGDDDDAGAK